MESSAFIQFFLGSNPHFPLSASCALVSSRGAVAAAGAGVSRPAELPALLQRNGGHQRPRRFGLLRPLDNAPSCSDQLRIFTPPSTAPANPAYPSISIC